MNTAVKKNQAVAEPLPQGSHRFVSERLSLAISLRNLWYRLTHWETWDWRVKYILIGPAWLWFCFRARSFWFFTASNPTLTFGGFDGESKKEMYDQLPLGTYPQSVFIVPGTTFEEVLQIVAQNGLAFPLAVKPDVARMGLMFRRVDSAEALQVYHQRMHSRYIIQEYINYPLEVSVFYYRMPGSTKGAITGFVRKDFLQVTGDGRSTLWDLIVNHPRARLRLKELRAKHRDKLHYIIEPGERYCLSPALNLSRGGKLVSLEGEKDERLLKLFDEISHYTGGFYYGRYDVRCRSVDDLKAGKHFSILEYNGSGAEPHHVYGNNYSLWDACSILVAHWNVLYRISRANHGRGIPYWEFRRGWKFLKEAGLSVERLRHADRQMPVTSRSER